MTHPISLAELHLPSSCWDNCHDINNIPSLLSATHHQGGKKMKSGIRLKLGFTSKILGINPNKCFSNEQSSLHYNGSVCIIRLQPFNFGCVSFLFPSLLSLTHHMPDWFPMVERPATIKGHQEVLLKREIVAQLYHLAYFLITNYQGHWNQ